MVYTKGYKYKPKMANGKLENGTKALKQFHVKQKNTQNFEKPLDLNK